MLIIVESFFNAKRISVVDIVLVVNDETLWNKYRLPKNMFKN